MLYRFSHCDGADKLPLCEHSVSVLFVVGFKVQAQQVSSPQRNVSPWYENLATESKMPNPLTSLAKTALWVSFEIDHLLFQQKSVNMLQGFNNLL